MKTCSRCKETKPFKGFSKDKYHSSGYKSACKVCAQKDFSEWRSTNLESARKQDRVSHYKRTYNLSPEEAEKRATSRLGKCLICKDEAPLVVDHSHVTNKVRGYVCSSCNSVLGYARDSQYILEQAILYLRKSNEDDLYPR